MSTALKRSGISVMSQGSPPRKASAERWNGCEGPTAWPTEMTVIPGAFKDKTVLVTGGGGSIGTNLVAALSERGARRIIVFDNLSSAYDWNVPKGQKIRMIRGDVTDDKRLSAGFVVGAEIVFYQVATLVDTTSV